MYKSRLLRLGLLLALLASLVTAMSPELVYASSGGSYQEVKLVSDLPNIAAHQDTNLVNAWGLSRSPTGPWWVADNGTGMSTVYDGNGNPFPSASPIRVTIPLPNGGTGSAPTGTVFNGRNTTDPDDFQVSKNGKSAPSLFLFATEDGTIAGWNPTVDPANAVVVVDHSSSAVYKGLAISQSAKGDADYIYAANFRSGWVEMFNGSFKMVKTFTDKKLASNCPMPGQCYAPFGIQNIRGYIFVTYALQNAEKKDDVAGAGFGFVDMFSANGRLLRRFAAHGKLNSPWGMVLAPSNFGKFSNDLLVGNFGDGHINAYNPRSGKFVGQLSDQSGTPFYINGLWALAFGNNGNAGASNELFFASGLNDEANGLFGKIVVMK